MNGLCQARLWCRLCWLWLGWEVGRDVGEACRLGGARLYYVFIIQITKSENWPGMSSFHPETVMTSKFSNTRRVKLAQIYLTCSRVPWNPTPQSTYCLPTTVCLLKCSPDSPPATVRVFEKRKSQSAAACFYPAELLSAPVSLFVRCILYCFQMWKWNECAHILYNTKYYRS